MYPFFYFATKNSCKIYDICYNLSMSKIKKLLEKFFSEPKDLEWREFIKILSYYGFEIMPPGITGGSRRAFENKNGVRLYFHEPHPSKIIKTYVIKQTIEILKKEGLL